jgi:GAF domain-containing protein/anti-anti-sigma regulatory factor
MREVDMDDAGETRGQLVDELTAARSRVAELEGLEVVRRQALAEAQRRVTQLGRVYEVGRRVSGQLDLEVLLSEVVIALQDAFDYSGVMLLLLDEETQRLTLQSIAGGYVDAFPESLSLAVGEGMIGRAAETGETQISQEPDYAQAEGRSGSELALPIQSGQRVIGVLDLQSDDIDAFGESERVDMETLGAQIAATIENARLFAVDHSRAERLSVINRIARVVSSTLDLDALMEGVYQEVVPAFQADAFFIALYDEEAGELDLRFQVSEGMRQPPGRVPLGAGPHSIVIAAKKPLVIRDWEQAQGYLSERVLAGTGKAPASWLGAPLLVGERVLGIVSVQAYHAYAWDEEDERLLLTIADQTAVALQNALLFEDRERRVTELAIVNEIGRTISSTREVDDLLKTVQRQVSRLFDTTDFFIASYEEESDEWAIIFWMERGQLQPPGLRRKGRTGLTGHVIGNRQPLLFRSREEIVAFHEAQGMEFIGEKALSWLGVPLTIADKVIGVMAIQSYDQENLYNERDVALFSTVAAQVAPTLDNLRLLEETRRRAREMEVIHEVGQTITSLLDLDVVLRQIVDITKARFGHYFVNIALVEGERLLFRSGSTIGDSGVRPGSGLAGIDLMQGASLAAEAARTGQPVLVGDTVNDPRYLAVKELPDTRSELCVPIKAQGRVIGMLDVQSDRPLAYDQADVKLLQSLANQASVAIGNARLFEAARLHAVELTVLNELSQALTTHLSVEEVLEVTYRGASRLLDTANFAVGLYDPAQGEITFAFTMSESEIDSQITIIPVSQGLNGYVIRNRVPVLIPDHVVEWQEEAGIELVGEPAMSWLGVPLIVGDQVLGAVSVQSFTTPRAYGEHDRDLLVAVASQAAIALQNARLYEAIEQELAERKRAERALQQAYAEVERQVEERTAELQREVVGRERAQVESLRLQQEVIEAQKQTLQELSTPIIPIMDRIIVMPLIGSIDSLRARDITRALLAGIQEHRARVVILDITGVPVVDSGVANYLNKTIQAAQLKGAHTIVTGVSDAVAEAIVDLGIDWTGIATVSDLQTGLAVALGGLGIKLTSR